MRGWGVSRVRRGALPAVLLSALIQIFFPNSAATQGRNNLVPPELTAPVPVAPGTGSPGADACSAAFHAAGGGAARADDSGGARGARRLRALWPRRAADQRRPDLARLRGQARRHGRLPPDQRGPGGGADIRAAARKLCRPCQSRSCQRRQGGAIARGDRARGVSKFPPAPSGLEGRVGDVRIPAGTNLVRYFHRQPVRHHRAAADRAERHDRRRRAAAGRHLLHRVELRRRQFGCALRRACAGSEAHRHCRHASRRGHHAQARQRYPAARRSPTRNGRC